MSSTIKQYKLVPAKIYDNLMGQQNKDINIINDELDNKNSDCTPITSNIDIRSINDIQEKALSQKQSLSQMVNRSKHRINSNPADQPDKKIMGINNSDDANPANHILRNADGNVLSWTHNTATQLPKYSQQSKIEDTHDQYNYILNANNIPQNIKMKLMEYMYNKYKMSKQPNHLHDMNESIISSDDECNRSISNINENDQKAAITDVISATPPGMLNITNKLATQLMRQKKYIQWSADGEILYPVEFYKSKIITIDKLIRILIYPDVGGQNELRAVQTLIKPFYKSIKSYVKNKNIQSAMALLDYHKGSTSGRKSVRHAHLKKSYVPFKI